VNLSFESFDLRNEIKGFIDSKTSYLGERMIVLLDKHNNVDDRSRCIMIVAKLDVYLEGLSHEGRSWLTVVFIVSSVFGFQYGVESVEGLSTGCG